MTEDCLVKSLVPILHKWKNHFVAKDIIFKFSISNRYNIAPLKTSLLIADKSKSLSGNHLLNNVYLVNF